MRRKRWRREGGGCKTKRIGRRRRRNRRWRRRKRGVRTGTIDLKRTYCPGFSLIGSVSRDLDYIHDISENDTKTFQKIAWTQFRSLWTKQIATKMYNWLSSYERCWCQKRKKSPHWRRNLLHVNNFFFPRSPAISLGFTTFGWDFCVCDRLLIQPLR